MATVGAEQVEAGIQPVRNVEGVNCPVGKYLTFTLAGEEYGLDILKVVEIVGLMPVTRVPGTHAYVKGVINLRGKIVPTIDLGAKLGIPPGEEKDTTCIVVVKVNGIETGILVDAVSAVVDIPNERIEEIPALRIGVGSDGVCGISKAGGKVRILLDLDQLLSEPVMAEDA